MCEASRSGADRQCDEPSAAEHIAAKGRVREKTSHDDVRANAEAIYERLAAGSMPCDGPWPTESVECFRTWIDNGSPP